jgi:hypothetical protein
VENREDGGKVTKSFQSKTVTTKYGDDGKVITTTGSGNEGYGFGSGIQES